MTGPDTTGIPALEYARQQYGPDALAPRRMHDQTRPPGFRWPLLLGLTGFTAGFFGPMLFAPEANQGPLVGILLSGPGGVVLGLVLLGLCTAGRVQAQTQWRLLTGTAIVGALVVLIIVQPQPALRGYVMDLEIRSCTALADADEEIIDYWTGRITDTSWAAARAGWQQDMRRTLQQAPGVILEVAVQRQVSVHERRKPWNRGALFTTPGRNAPEEHSFHYAGGACRALPAGHQLRVFEKYDLDRRIEAPAAWPPRELEELLSVSTIVAVPEPYARLLD